MCNWSRASAFHKRTTSQLSATVTAGYDGHKAVTDLAQIESIELHECSLRCMLHFRNAKLTLWFGFKLQFNLNFQLPKGVKPITIFIVYAARGCNLQSNRICCHISDKPGAHFAF